MPTFNDAEGREWKLSLTYSDIRRVQESTGHNLCVISDRQYTEEELAQLPLDQHPLCMRLMANSLVLLDVLFALVEPQAKTKGVPKEGFEAAITPEIFATASQLFWKEYQDFFRRAGQTGQALMIESIAEMATATVVDETETATSNGTPIDSESVNLELVSAASTKPSGN